MRKSYRDDNGEKIYRYSIRKYHFGAASVAVAALMFFANGVAAQEAPAVSPATASNVVAGSSGNSDGDPENSAEENSKQALPDQPEGKPAGELKAQGAKAEEANQGQELEKSKPAPVGQETPQAEGQEKQDQPTTADRKAAKSTQGILEALLAKLTLSSMQELHAKVEARLAAAKAVLDDPNATQEQVDEQVRLMEDLISRVNKVLGDAGSPSAGLATSGLATSDGAVLTPKVAVTEVLEENRESSTDREVRTTSTELSKTEISDNQDKDKLKTLSRDLSAYLIQANEITRPETKKLLEGVEEVVKSIEASVSQPQLTPTEIEELLKKGKQAEKKLFLAISRENSGKRDVRNRSRIARGADFRANPTGLDTKRAYIVQNGDGSGLPAETYLYALERGIASNPNSDNVVPVKDVLGRAKMLVANNGNGKYTWTVTFNKSNKGGSNDFYWFTLPEGHKITKTLGITRTYGGSSSSIGSFDFNTEWKSDGKIKTIIGEGNKAVHGPAKGPFDFNTKFRSLRDVTNSLINPKVVGGSNYDTEDPAAYSNKDKYYYLGELSNKFVPKGIPGTAVPQDVRDKAARNIAGMHDNTEHLYHFTLDNGTITITYETETEKPYAPLYYAAGMRTIENNVAKMYFMARGLQEKPNAPEISDNNVGTVTVKPNTEKADKVEINYVGSDASAKKATLTRNAQNGTWSSDDSGIEVSGTSFIIKPNAVKVGTKVKAKSWFGNSDPSDEASGDILRRTDKPTVTPKEDGSVTVKPSTNATHLTISYTDETSKQTKTITADKTGSSWGLKGDSAITINGNSGEVTIPANSVADSTKVEAQAKAPGEALSEKAEATAKDQDRIAPTIQVRKNGTSTWLTADSKGNIIVPVAPGSGRTLELDVLISDNQGGSGIPDFSSRPGGTVTKNITGTYKNNSDIYGSFGKASDATAKLSFALNDENAASDVKTNVTVTLNAKDNAGNWTNATNKKEVTVKIVSAKPNYPSRVKVLNPTNIQETEKDTILTAIKEANKTNEANPTFTKGTNGITATYTDGTTYEVPYSDVITYVYSAKKKTINVGEAPNWGSPKQYFTYEDGSAIGDDRTFLWKNSMNATAPNNPDLTVGTNKTVEVLAPNPEGGAPKTLTLTYDVVDNQPPKVKINGVELGENVDQNPRFAIYRGAEFNPTFEVSDNSGKTTYLKASELPSGVWFNKQGGNDVEKTDLTNNTTYTLTTNNIVDNTNTLGEHTASVTVKDASRNTKTYQFKYVIVDIEARNTPETVPLNTKLVDPADKDHAKDSRNYVKVSDGNATKPDGDDGYYATDMSFTWSKNNTSITNKTLLSTPGIVEYTAVVTFPNNGATYSKTVDGKTVTVYPPKKDTVTVTFKVKPTAPTVTPATNGDVTVTPANETNVNKIQVTYTPSPTIATLTETDQDTFVEHPTTQLTASKNAQNKWSITEGAKDGISIDATSGAITINDATVKDGSKVVAKAITSDSVESTENRATAQEGDKTKPTVGLGNTLVQTGKQITLNLNVSDSGVGVDDNKVEVKNLPAGLKYNSANKTITGSIATASKTDIKVLVRDKKGNKTVKTVSLVAVKPKPIYAIKDGTIPNVATASNFVEMPTGVTLSSATWKNGAPTTATVGTVNKPVTVSVNGYTAADVDVPVTVYPTAVAKKDKFTTLLNKGLPEGDDASSYVQFKNQENKNVNKPANGVTVAWINKPSTSVQTDTTGNNTKGSVKVTYSVTNADGTVGSVEKIIDINLKVYHATPTTTHVTTTFGTDFGGTSNNAQTYFTSNSPKTSSAWKSTSNATFSEYASYSRTSEKQKANYLGKYKDGIQVFMAGDDDNAINWTRSEKFDVTFEVKPLTPTVEGATTDATSLTVNNVNSGTTVELYDMSNPAQPNKIGETTVAKEGEFNKKDKINVPLLAGKTLNPGAKIVAKVVYTSGSDRTESDSSSEVVIKHPKPAAPIIRQWQNGNVKVTPDSTNSGDKITIPLKTGSVVVTKNDQNEWQVTGQPNGVSVRNGSIEIPRNLVNTTVTATASKGEGDVAAVSNEGTHTLTTHEVTKVDIIKKPTDTIAETDLSGATGITGVTDNNVPKAYANAEITSVGFTNGKPTLTPDSEQNVLVTITYNDGSKETTPVTLKVAPAAPNVTVNAQDKTTGDVTLTIKRHNNSNYPNDSVVTVPGIAGTFKVKDGTITIMNNQLKDTVQTGKVTVTETGKLPAETSDDKNIPAKMVESATPTVTFGTPAKDSGDIEVTVMNGTAPYAKGSKITLPGIAKEYEVGDNGKITVPNSELPDSATPGAPKATETGKLPKAGSSVTTPAKMVESATPTDDTNPRPDTVTPAEVPATQPAEQPSQTVEVPAQLPNEVSETNPSVSQPQAVLPNTGTQEDRATGAFGVLSLLGAFGLLFAKKKKDDEEEA